MSKLCIPENILNQHLVVLGKTGKGKSSLLRHIVEHLLTNGKRVVIIDPKGDWWGLKSSADGKGPGYPVVAFGDFKEAKAQDVPINERSGKQVAELVATGNRPAVIGFRGWMPGQMVKFWLDFAPTLFNMNAGELFLVGDEFHNFAPKGKILDPNAGKCLHWSNKIMSEGRGLGLICLIASQRPQKVHNDTLTCCETLIAMGVNHAADRKAVKDWIDGCGDPEQGKEVLNNLAGLGRGEAYVWSPEIKFGPELIKFPMFETFDSFAPPQLQKKVSEKGWADVSLDEIKSKLSAVIEEAKANDPAELRRQIAELKKALLKSAQATPPAPKPQIEVKAVPMLNEKDIARLEKLGVRIESTVNNFLLKVRNNFDALGPPHPQQVREWKKTPQHVPPRQHIPREIAPPTEGTNGELTRGERTVLAACIQFPDGLERQQMTVLTGFKRSTRDTYLQRLRQKGFVEASGNIVVATPAGIAALPDHEPLPTGQALQDYWRGRLPRGELALFEILLEVYPAAIARDELGESAGQMRSTRDTYLQRMRSKQLVTEPGRGLVKASDNLF